MLYVIIAVITIIIIYAVALYFAFKANICRVKLLDLSDEKVTKGTEYEPATALTKKWLGWLDEQQTELVSITSFDGIKLNGFMLPAKDKSNRFVIAMHGFTTCGRNDFASVLPFFHYNNINVLVPDQRVHGNSEGKYKGFGVLERYDVKAWAQYLTERFGNNIKIALHGVSMGGASVIMASGLKLPDTVICVSADCAFTSPAEIFKHVLKTKYHIPPVIVLPVINLICKHFCKWSLYECDTRKIVSESEYPYLFIHGAKDTYVPTYMSKENYEACKGLKRIHIVGEAKHGMSYCFDPEGCKNAITEFYDAVGF